MNDNPMPKNSPKQQPRSHSSNTMMRGPQEYTIINDKKYIAGSKERRWGTQKMVSENGISDDIYLIN